MELVWHLPTPLLANLRARLKQIISLLIDGKDWVVRLPRDSLRVERGPQPFPSSTEGYTIRSQNLEIKGFYIELQTYRAARYMAHFPTWSHGISMWLRWHLDCIYCLAMGHLSSPWVWQPLLWRSSHLTGTGERCVLYIKLVSVCLSSGICFSVSPSSFQEEAHTKSRVAWLLEVVHEYMFITLTYMIHSRTFMSWLLLIRVQIILLVVNTVGCIEYLCTM